MQGPPGIQLSNASAPQIVGAFLCHEPKSLVSMSEVPTLAGLAARGPAPLFTVLNSPLPAHMPVERLRCWQVH